MNTPSALLAALVVSVPLANAAITISNVNTPTAALTFDSLVGTSVLTGGTVGSGASAYTDDATMLPGIQTVVAANVNAALTEVSNLTTQSDVAKQDTTNGVVYLRPNGSGNSGAGAVLLMAALHNNTGSGLNTLGVEFDYARASGSNGEDIAGLRMYYNLTGLAADWKEITSLQLNTTAALATPDHLNLNVGLASTWANNSTIYVLWADDNRQGAENAYTIDNLSFSGSSPVTVPEPSVALLGGLGAVALLRRRRN